jgi:hypothetical protein
MLRLLITIALLGAGWTTQPLHTLTCPETTANATYAGRCFASPHDTWLLEEDVWHYSPSQAVSEWEGMEIAGSFLPYGHSIQKPTHIGHVQVFSYWDGMEVNIDMWDGDNVAQILLSSNPNIVNGFPEPPLSLVRQITEEAARKF